jgi:hypothetical protein
MFCVFDVDARPPRSTNTFMHLTFWWVLTGYYTGKVTNATKDEMHVSLRCGEQVIQWRGPPLSTRWRYSGAT